LPAEFEIIEETPENGHLKAIVKLPDDVNSNQLLQKLLPHLHVHSFNEIIPGMNEVFIRTVTAQKLLTNQNIGK
jgi:ABC-2 type transport system ATP-binding protein